MVQDVAAAFGHRLRELREGVGFTQGQLAQRAGLHPQGVVKLERGEREPAWSTLLALAGALGVSVAAFAERPTTPATPRGRGRPPKAKGGEGNTDPEPSAKKTHGRPRKGK